MTSPAPSGIIIDWARSSQVIAANRLHFSVQRFGSVIFSRVPFCRLFPLENFFVSSAGKACRSLDIGFNRKIPASSTKPFSEKTFCFACMTLLALSASVGIGSDNGGTGERRQEPGERHHPEHGLRPKSYSPLEQINKSNVKHLVPIWSTSLMNDQGELAAPTIYNGVMYVINGKWTFAIDVETGRQIWRTPVQLEPETRRTASTEARQRSITANSFA